LQQIAERLVGKLLKRFLGLAREEVECVPGLRIELDQFSPGLCRLLGHEKTPLERGRGPVAHSKPNGNITIMSRRAYLIFGDIEDQLDVLRVECTKCARKGRYSVRRLIEKYGRKANMMKWKEQLTGDCPRRDALSLHERCDLICPDLPKVL
jgi:hypothetical protein